MSATVLLGNVAPYRQEPDELGAPRPVPADLGGNTVTEVIMREGYDDADASRLALSTDNDPVLVAIREVLPDKLHDLAVAVLEVNDAWSTAHSADPPEWVESTDKRLAQALAAWWTREVGDLTGVDVARLASEPAYGTAMSTRLAGRDHECVIGRPDGWTSVVDVPPLAGGAHATEWSHFDEDLRSRARVRELLTNAGRDAIHAQHFGTGAQPAAVNYLAVSANTTAESAANTTLPGEITTAGGGLIRKQATYAHTAGTNTSTLTATFTANGSDTLPVTLAKVGALNAASGGTLGYEKLLGTTATISASGDNAAITFTGTVG